ncbi:ATP-binding cassette domain-containing protein, partial [Hydrogenibacillus schlegelii]|uniref:ATP-binding cassette domain-containing protein n=1 Tax=Hydrogenibacillus schlegelii TaxID=1484 RepID=UPI0034A062E3
MRGVRRREALRQAEAILRDFGLGAFVDRYPSALSGGMRQRAGLARGLVQGTALLLMDQPVGPRAAQTPASLHEWRVGGCGVTFPGYGHHALMTSEMRRLMANKPPIGPKRPRPRAIERHLDDVDDPGRPGEKTTIRSARYSASSTSWVTMRIVRRSGDTPLPATPGATPGSGRPAGRTARPEARARSLHQCPSEGRPLPP